MADFDYGSDMAPFFDDIQRIVIREPGYGGMGGHGLDCHGPHGLHRELL